MLRLIGVLDSPYVRRTAISFSLMGIAFKHEALSVFSNFAEFKAINPAVKAPTLVLESGEVLMDSNMIIQFAESLVERSRRLTPTQPEQLRQVLQVVGSALAACEKAVQLFYEYNLRPVDKQLQAWAERVTGQLLSACRLLEQQAAKMDLAPAHLNQAHITAAVVWQFIQSVLAEEVPVQEFPHLQTLSLYAESLPVFLAFPPVGPGTGSGVSAA